jgi:CRISPR-associated endonuclease/helicase Cas3
MNDATFSLAFKALTGFGPLRWQARLYEKWFSVGQVPAVCDLPTGLGKTSVIPIWLIALASQLSCDQVHCLPRRLVYIVNRRTVVDQATDIAEQLRQRIVQEETADGESGEALKHLRSALAKAAAIHNDQLIAISTLRGELADNEEWKADPARPAIIIGTIDMVGSKLLFSGYGDGYKMRPHHAGLIGQDALIVHDEAHLTPAFGTLLRSVSAEQKRCNEPRPIQVMELSATALATGHGDVFSLEPEDEEDVIVRDRLDARKALFFVGANLGTTDEEVSQEGAALQETAASNETASQGPAESQERHRSSLFERIVERALIHQQSNAKVLIYVRSPETAKEIVSSLKRKLNSGGSRIALLTGTIRGHERDSLVQTDPVYRAFLDHGSQPGQAVCLVSTSAGEVGIDLDADHLICDLTTLDSMIQRIGRVNRFGGEGRDARIEVILDDEGEKEKRASEGNGQDTRKARTREILQKLPRRDDGGHLASPRALRDLLNVKVISADEKEQAFSEQPPIAPATDILFDAWSLTTIQDQLPGRPQVAEYLHGITADPPETYIAWRYEVKLLAEANTSSKTLREWFRRCPIQSRERLRDYSNRVTKELQKLAKRLQNASLPCILLDERGNAKLMDVQSLLKTADSELPYRTVVLSVETGGLTSEGFLDGREPARPNQHAHDALDLDVAEADGKRARLMMRRIEDEYSHHSLNAVDMTDADSDTTELEEYPSPQQAAAAIARRYGKVLSQIVPLREAFESDEGEGESRYLVLLLEPREAATETPETAAYEQQPRLGDHLRQAGSIAGKIASALRLNGPLKDAVIAAACWHDRGKDRKRWQRAIFNEDPTLVFAKSGTHGMDWRRLAGYRHEFGSMLDAARDIDIFSMPEADLVLHLIAAHHGRARPHFDEDAWDMERYKTSENEEAACEAMRRFGRLQQRFGRWGLAWLESLVRCADVIASQQAQETTAITPEDLDR